jgi:protoporphyrinogen oxidase
MGYVVKESPGKVILIVGGGLTALMSALKLKKLNPDKEIVVFDKSNQLGGMYGGLTYPDDVCFDYGMHVIYESCNPEIDDLYREVMAEEEWNIYENNDKDIAGLFFKGRLQTYSHYVDLRSFSEVDKKNFISSLLIQLDSANIASPRTAMDYLRNQFGKDLVDFVHKPILKRMYGIDPEDLDLFAIKATALERVILFDTDTMLDLMSSSKLRARLAFPDQLKLPPVRNNTQKALYPKKFGMSHFIEKLRKHIQSMGVQILTETSISKVIQDEGLIDSVSLTNKEWGERIVYVDRMLWTAGWPSLALQLGLNISDLTFHKGLEIVFVNLIFNRPLLMERLYYFYCYDEEFASFRVTNYANYCPDAAKKDWFPIGIELWPSKIGRKAAGIDEDECIRLAVDELKRFGIIGSDHKLMFAKTERNVGEFPMPSIENTKSLRTIRTRVENQKIANLTVAGVMANEGLFFIPDILNDVFPKLHDF